MRRSSWWIDIFILVVILTNVAWLAVIAHFVVKYW